MVWDFFSEFVGFDWDSGNADKNWMRHKVTQQECEEIFFNQPLIVALDTKHSDNEERQFVLGQTNSGRKLFLVFTTRRKKLRVVSARDMSKKERVTYGKQKNT